MPLKTVQSQMTTDQKYVGKANYANPNEPTAQNRPPVVEIPASLLEQDENQVLSDFLQLAQNPAVTSLKPGVVLAAINAAYRLGTEQERISNRMIVLPLSFNRFGGSFSPFQAVYSALSFYRNSLLEQSSDCDNSELIAGLNEILDEMTYRVLEATDLRLLDGEGQHHA